MLETERLNLVVITHADLQQVHELHSLPETDEFNTLGIPETIQITELVLNEWLKTQTEEPGKSYVFKICRKDDGRFIGLIGLKMGKVKYSTAEAWFKIHKNFWRNGYATEALIKLLEFGFNNLNLHRIEAGCADENIASGKVLEKAGMIREGIKRKKLPLKRGWTDNYFYGILEEDFKK